MSVILTRNDFDRDMVELRSISPKGNQILWGVIHSDVLGDLGMTDEDLDNAGEVELFTTYSEPARR